MLTLASLTLLIISARPHCGAETAGQMWPPAANQDQALVMKLAREGNLRICTMGLWQYQWQSPTVTLRQMEDPSSENWRGKGHGPSFTKR